MTGIFTISLDFELHWGAFDKRDRELHKERYINTLKVVPQLLELFSRNEVNVTWATVGSLFANDKDEWMAYLPEQKPAYKQTRFSAYQWVEKNDLPIEYSWAHFAPEEVRLITQYEGQELGTHTFAHYYCLEPGQTVAQFENDLGAAQRISQDKVGQSLTSLVFPRNQFNSEYLKACYRQGIKVVRSNPDKWFWTGITEDKTTLARKLFRTGDTYTPLGGITSYPVSAITQNDDEPMLLPASRLLRPYDRKYPALNKLRLKRILKEMKYAAKHGHCYHLWWHPENFGDDPDESIKDLTAIIQHYSNLKNSHGMQSWNMAEYIGRTV